MVEKNAVSNDSLVKIDSIKTPESLEAIVTHNAEDYIKQRIGSKTVELYNRAVLKYKDIEIKAGKIIVDYKRELVYAFGIYDSVNKYVQRPILDQGGQKATQDSIIYHFKTRKANIFGSDSQQGDMFTHSKQLKKINDSTIFARNVRFTTSKDKNPDYYLEAKRAKIIPNKKIIVGSTQLVVADVPTPLVVPFAYFPLTKSKASGVIVPSYGDSREQGFFLQNGGFYFAGNDYFDLRVVGDIYSNSSWGIRVNSNYLVRYKFGGNFNLSYENLIANLKGFPNYTKRNNFNLRWTHTPDAKATPNSRFSVSVNFGSSNYYRQSLNDFNSPRSLTNNMGSSISYFRNFVGTPFNLSVTASHSQNTNTERMTLSLPNLSVNMNRIYPFAPKSGTKKNALQNIGLTYTMNFDNRYDIPEKDFMTEKMYKKAQTGIKQTVNTSTNIKLFKYFTLNPSVNYNENSTLSYIKKRYDPTKKEIKTDTINGFKSFREYGGGMSVSTVIYGMKTFSKGKIRGIRHVITPSISYNFRPDFSFYKQSVYNPSTGRSEEYTPFDGTPAGSPSSGLSSSIGITVNNNLEAKIAQKDDQGKPMKDKKIKILNNLSITTAYNIAADSLRWSPVAISTGTQLFNNRLSLNGNLSMDPYQQDLNGNRSNQLLIENGGGLLRLTNASIASSFSISDKDFDKKSKGKKTPQKQQNQSQLPINPITQDFGRIAQNRLNNNQNNNEEGTQNDNKKDRPFRSKIRWQLNFQHTLNYNANTPNGGEITSNSLSFSGNLGLSEKWKITINSGYDFKNEGFTHTRLMFSRDLRSWHTNFGWTPFGRRTSYNFFIGVKSSILSDLKWEKNKTPDRRLF